MKEWYYNINDQIIKEYSLYEAHYINSIERLTVSMYNYTGKKDKKIYKSVLIKVNENMDLELLKILYPKEEDLT